MEKIWHNLYAEELKVLSEEHPLLITEAPLNPLKNREIMSQILFETFNVPSLYIAVQAVMALYASGRTTGVVLDSGDGVSHAIPVFDGFAIHNSIRRIDIAGRDITEYLQWLLRRSGYNLITSAEKDIVREIKEKICYVSFNPLKEEREFKGQRAVDEYVLPDGQVIKLGQERFRAPEILFNPEILGSECSGVHEVIVDAIKKTDLDLRRSLYSNIVLSGGSTLFKGFGDRLLNEVKKVSAHDVKIKIYAPPERKYSTWIGGSILASLSTFSNIIAFNLEKIWVSAEEYQEDPNIIHRKMF